jgi:hypothetical protein
LSSQEGVFRRGPVLPGDFFEFVVDLFYAGYVREFLADFLDTFARGLNILAESACRAFNCGTTRRDNQAKNKQRGY